jgi:hypothetical protein
MATTTNYGWTTPDNTALVKDGASAIRTLGSSVDTSLKSLSPGTTAGDVDYYTSSTAKARLGIGSTGQVLTVAAGVPSWATPTSGGMTLLSTTTLSGATVTISSISQSYNYLFGVVYGVTNATANGVFRLYPNASSNTTTLVRIGPSATATEASASFIQFTGGAETAFANANNAWSFQIYNYTSTTNYKPFMYGGQFIEATTSRAIVGSGSIISNSAITSLQFSNASGNLSTGTVLLYGVK